MLYIDTGGINLKQINLKDIYPHYTEDQYVLVSDEVADLISESENAEKNYERRARRYGATVSLDRVKFFSRNAEYSLPSADDEFERQEIQKELFDALSSLEASQAKRIVAHYVQNKTCREIAIEEGVNKQAVSASIGRGMRSLKKILISHQKTVDKSAIFDLYNERTFSFLSET